MATVLRHSPRHCRLVLLLFCLALAAPGMSRPVRADVALAALCSAQKPFKDAALHAGQHDCCSSHASAQALPLQHAGMPRQAMQPVQAAMALPGNATPQSVRPRMRDPPGLPFTA